MKLTLKIAEAIYAAKGYFKVIQTLIPGKVMNSSVKLRQK